MVYTDMQDEASAQPSGTLRDMLIAARYVENGIVDLEKRLMSVEGLMPNEDNKEEAAEVAQRIFREVKELEVSLSFSCYWFDGVSLSF